MQFLSLNYSWIHYLNVGYLFNIVNSPSKFRISTIRRKLLIPEYYFPLTTSAHRGQSVSEDSDVYFQQRGHFSFVVGMTITLYEDSS